MTDASDMDLVREFGRNQSEAAFTELVRRHLNLVYSIARRCTDNDGDAQDVAQVVFVILARKAAGLRARTVLTGWLYETTRYTAACVQRTNARRHFRDQEAYMQSTLTEDANTAADWHRLAPHLEAGMSQLGEGDRTLLALRFYENKNGSEAAAILGIREAAAHKRTARALEKLRKFFTHRGVTLSTAAIAGAVSANSVQAAPVGLAVTVTAAAVKGTAISTTIAALIKGTMKTITWLKIKFAMGVGVAVVLSGVVATLAIANKANEANEEKATPPIGSHAGVTFFSILESPPIVANGVFEKEVFGGGVPAQARKQTFSFLADGDNYRLSTEGIGVGKFEGSSWQQNNGYLVVFDPKANKPDGYSGGVVQDESICKMTVDLFLTLGIKEMVPGSAVWDQDKKRFTAKTEDGKDLVVETILENGVPATAYILADDGQKYELVQFKYSPGFYGGQVPVEFTAYWIKPGAETEKSNDQKIYDIRVKALEISDEHLDKTLLNPTAIAGNSAAMFYSNNVLYQVIKGGKVSRVLTTEENEAEIKMLRDKK
jgi:RNA polymerase sigma factor (sigma-70 family)